MLSKDLGNLLQKLLQERIDEAERNMAAMIGATIYKQENGFSQEQLYNYGGRYDSVFTLTFRDESESSHIFGPMITVCFEYSMEERKALEKDSSALNDNTYVKAELLCKLLGRCKKEKILINTSDIIAMTVLPSMEDNNTYVSREKRSLNVIEIPFESEGGGDDIYLSYGLLCHLKQDGIGLMPEYEYEFLACKYLLDKDKLTEEEKKQIYNEYGRVGNPNIAYRILFWRKAAGQLNEKESRIYNILKEKRDLERVRILDQELKRIGIPFNKFCKDYPEQAHFIYEKLQTFNDRSFNTTGRFPLYMDFKSFLHIYLRHVDILNMGSQLAQKDKFQLYEKDVLMMIDHVMRALNDEYQIYREANPDKKFVRKGDMAYYCRGDYYEVYVDNDGRLETIYKASRNKD